MDVDYEGSLRDTFEPAIGDSWKNNVRIAMRQLLLSVQQVIQCTAPLFRSAVSSPAAAPPATKAAQVCCLGIDDYVHKQKLRHATADAKSAAYAFEQRGTIALVPQATHLDTKAEILDVFEEQLCPHLEAQGAGL